MQDSLDLLPDKKESNKYRSIDYGKGFGGGGFGGDISKEFKYEYAETKQSNYNDIVR